jgi:CDP-diacylglycerol--serine O-phosphatidyltransferase
MKPRRNLRNLNKSEDRRRGIYLLPNLLTTAAMFCGFFSIVQSINGEFGRAAWAILFAGIFDALDGRVARLTHTHSDFGVEYDSLSDLTSFGLAPAVLAYTWTLGVFGKFGWAAAFLFFACGALRLARYNIQKMDEERRHFQGLPIPPAAYAIAGYVIFHIHWKGSDVTVNSLLMLLMAVGLAFLMVSTIPYQSFKNLNWRSRQSFLVLVGMAVALFIVASAPTVMIFLITMVYVGSGLVSYAWKRFRSRHRQDEDEESPELAAEHLRIIDGAGLASDEHGTRYR